jgi:hypothetical protein
MSTVQEEMSRISQCLEKMNFQLERLNVNFERMQLRRATPEEEEREKRQLVKVIDEERVLNVAVE